MRGVCSIFYALTESEESNYLATLTHITKWTLNNFGGKNVTLFIASLVCCTEFKLPSDFRPGW